MALPAQTFTTLFNFDSTDGGDPSARLAQATNGEFYGTTVDGGGCVHYRLGCGTVFKITPTCALSTLHIFSYMDGAFPDGGLVQDTDGNFYGTTFYGGGNGFGTGVQITPSGTLTTLYSFCSTRLLPGRRIPRCGAGPRYRWEILRDNGLGRGQELGQVFSITAGGTLATLHSFDGLTEGADPIAGLIQGTDGDFYGATDGGASNACFAGCGTIFKITPSGTLTTLISFDVDERNGSCPYAALIEGSDGKYYGTTIHGGVNNGNGTVFSITAGGTLTTLHTFHGTDGSWPFGALVQGTDGNFYGATWLGGTGGCAEGCGTVFKITPSGTLTTLHSFDLTDGYEPYAGLVQSTNGNFYGTTFYGGAKGDGTVFEITPTGTLKTLYSFCSQSGCADGSLPAAGLVRATDGNLYGTTSQGGAYLSICLYDNEPAGCGTIFEITPSGTLTTLYSFNGPDGDLPYGTLVQDTNGELYGTTQLGGNFGSIFSLSVGLKPFVETEPTSGAVGTAVNILGSNLTGATSVTFNGTPAVFTVVSRSLITTTVPAGATTGTVEVVRPNGKGLSNVPFHRAAIADTLHGEEIYPKLVNGRGKEAK